MKTDLTWDLYFHNLCVAVASKSSCLSRQIGAILVFEDSIIATGFNGPPRGVSHCEAVRVEMPDYHVEGEIHYSKECPRYAAGYKSGEGLHLCPAAHAEANCIVNAARLGVSVLDTTMYMNCPIPCAECTKLIINAGITELVVEDATWYSTNTELMERLYLNGPKIRQFSFVHSVDKEREDKL